MNPFKKLITGQYPLISVAIFWFISQFLIGALLKTIPLWLIKHPDESLLYSIIASYGLKVVLSVCVLSGLISFLRRKFSIIYLLTTIFIILHIIFNGYLFFTSAHSILSSL